MRPRKVVVVVDQDEARQSRMAFLLRLRKYDPLHATNLEDAATVLAGEAAIGGDVRAVVVRIDGEPTAAQRAALLALRTEYPELRVLVLGSVQTLQQGLAYGRFVPKDAQSAAELLDCLRIACARSRGPRRTRELLTVGIQGGK